MPENDIIDEWHEVMYGRSAVIDDVYLMMLMIVGAASDGF